MRVNCYYNILDSIRHEMDLKGMSQKDLVDTTGINKSVLSILLKGKDRKMTKEQLDLITEALGLPRGYYYRDYSTIFFEEDYSDGFLQIKCTSPTKAERFLKDCIKYGLDEVVEDLLKKLFEARENDIVYSVAEEYYQSGQYDKAVLLYNEIIANGTYKTKKIASCYHKRFIIYRNNDLGGMGRESLYQLLDYVDYLDDEVIEKDGTLYCEKVHALYRICSYFNAMSEWNNLLRYAKKMEFVARQVKMDRYVGEGLLYQAIAYKRLGNREECFACIDRYEKINDYFARIAEGSRYYNFVEFGDITYIPQYIKWAKCDEELYTFIPVAIETLVAKGMKKYAQELLVDFDRLIQFLRTSTFPVHKKDYLRILVSSGKLKIEDGSGIDDLLEALKIAKEIGSVSKITEITAILFRNINLMSNEQRGDAIMILERG